MSLLGQNHPGQGTGPPQGLTANLQTAAGTPVLSATVPISLASGVSHAQVTITSFMVTTNSTFSLITIFCLDLYYVKSL